MLSSAFDAQTTDRRAAVKAEFADQAFVDGRVAANLFHEFPVSHHVEFPGIRLAAHDGAFDLEESIAKLQIELD